MPKWNQSSGSDRGSGWSDQQGSAGKRSPGSVGNGDYEEPYKLTAVKSQVRKPTAERVNFRSTSETSFYSGLEQLSNTSVQAWFFCGRLGSFEALG